MKIHHLLIFTPRNRTEIVKEFFGLLLLVFVCFSTAMPALYCSSAIAGTSEIQKLAKEAKDRFFDAMQPPIFKNPLILHAIMAETAEHREYMIHSFNEAIDALLAEANTPERSNTITKALRSFVKEKEIASVDQIFTEILERSQNDKQAIKMQEAAIIRHSVALVELPIALQRTTFPSLSNPSVLSPFVTIDPSESFSISLSRGLKPVPGNNVFPAYLKSAALDPQHFWTWIIIASFMQPQPNFEEALANAEKIALVSNDKHALIFVKNELGRLEFKAKNPEKALKANAEALNIAIEALKEAPNDELYIKDLATSLIYFGVSEKLSQPDQDIKPVITILEKAIELRQQLAADHPENSNYILDLAVAHYIRANHVYVKGHYDDDVDNQKHEAEALRVYNTLIAEDRFKPYFELSTGVFFHGSMLAVGWTLVIGILLLFLYRSQISRWMIKASNTDFEFNQYPSSDTTKQSITPSNIEFNGLSTVSHWGCNYLSSPPIANACKQLWKITGVYACGALAFSVVAGYLFNTTSDIKITQTSLSFEIIEYTWPLLITLWLLWGPDRKKFSVLLVCYFGVIAALGLQLMLLGAPATNVFGLNVPAIFSPMLIWFMAVIHSLYLLLFLNRYIRAIGPILLIFMIVLVSGSIIFLFFGSTPAGADVWFGTLSWLKQLTGLSEIQADHTFWESVLGALLCVPFAWWLTRMLCQSYEKKRYSEMTLIIGKRLAAPHFLIH